MAWLIIKVEIWNRMFGLVSLPAQLQPLAYFHLSIHPSILLCIHPSTPVCSGQRCLKHHNPLNPPHSDSHKLPSLCLCPH